MDSEDNHKRHTAVLNLELPTSSNMFTSPMDTHACTLGRIYAPIKLQESLRYIVINKSLKQRAIPYRVRLYHGHLCQHRAAWFYLHMK